MKKIVVTGGAGFVGSNIAIALSKSGVYDSVVVVDNLHRKGSELNIPRLEKYGIEFIRGDVRNPQDLDSIGAFDFLIECSAEPSVLAGSDGDTDYLIDTNLNGAINCANICHKYNAPMIFLSTSRVYPIDPLLNCDFRTTDTRYELTDKQSIEGLSSFGVSEEFPIEGARSLYGGTKYAAEVMLREYADAFNLPVVINRCGVLAGAWQFGKPDQGIAAFWTAAHTFGRDLKYIGFNGSGKQVRDMLHINDLIDVILLQVKNPENFSINKGVWNVGGGVNSSASLLELTEICQSITGKKVTITPDMNMRYADIPIYISDSRKIEQHCGWTPNHSIEDIITDIHTWIQNTPNAKSMFDM